MNYYVYIPCLIMKMKKCCLGGGGRILVGSNINDMYLVYQYFLMILSKLFKIQERNNKLIKATSNV